MKYATLVLTTLFTTAAQADRQSFAPVDEAVRDPSLRAFRTELLTHVAARDVDSIVALSCPDIYLSHGGSGGPAELEANLTQASDTPDDIRDAYWAALEETLSQPGYFDDEGEFWMPYQWKLTLPASLDPFTAYYVTGQNVTLRNGPARTEPALAQISHEVVIIPDYKAEAAYQLVRLTDGTRGYMSSDYLWSMVGYRAAFTKSQSGDWQLCTFVTGD